MDAFTVLDAIAAPLPDADIDTDILYPARFLTLTQKKGLGTYLLRDRRFDEDGRERPGFVLNRAPWREARILVTGPNFGCGSSREQAPWALADFGIRCLVGTSFGAIFEANCHRNGLLPVRLGDADHATAMDHASRGGTIRVDLVARTLQAGAAGGIRFEIPDRARTALLEGLDEVAIVLRDDGDAIAAFEANQQQRMPWLYPTLEGLPDGP